MLNIPEYKEYGGETKIALMDNSSLAFMHELSQRSYPSDGILSVYDLILIPKWVMEEIEDSTSRKFGMWKNPAGSEFPICTKQSFRKSCSIRCRKF